MKSLWQSFLQCFSTYSVLPVGPVEWSRESRKFTFCFLPLVGLFIGVAEFFWLHFATRQGLAPLFYSAVAAALPILLSGGMHMDGLLDTCDAVFSYGDREKRLAILKDPHVGAFGVIYGMVYFALLMGSFAQFAQMAYPPILLLFPFMLSRVLGGTMVLCWPSAKTSGLQYIFASDGEKRPTLAALVLWGTGLLFLLYRSFPASPFLLFCLGLFLLSLYLKFYFTKLLGGITGDIVGLAICLAELLFLLCYSLGGMFF